jgi:hypothetical protein
MAHGALSSQGARYAPYHHVFNRNNAKQAYISVTLPTSKAKLVKLIFLTWMWNSGGDGRSVFRLRGPRSLQRRSTLVSHGAEALWRKLGLRRLITRSTVILSTENHAAVSGGKWWQSWARTAQKEGYDATIDLTRSLTPMTARTRHSGGHARIQVPLPPGYLTISIHVRQARPALVVATR